MDTRRLGTDGPQVSALGLGAMGMSDLYGPADEAESIATIHQGENLAVNLALVDALRTVAESIGATVAQVAIGWVASRGADVVPLVGAQGRDRLQESLAAADLVPSDEVIGAIGAAVPAAAGERYPEQQMAGLDSEG
ncbi:aldo/keto reductase [Pseudonocardia sp. CA-142604]|uniref:aldo/keto reductase n=1 Tax=Pseudonocardia sp. CA-142604 TaxID=3240024 RepID=UPI003D8A4BDA